MTQPAATAAPDPSSPIRLKCLELRTKTRDIEQEVRSAKAFVTESKLSKSSVLEGVSHENFSEMLANYMLAVRHLEDARMRLGKVIQYLEGGTSIFDK